MLLQIFLFSQVAGVILGPITFCSPFSSATVFNINLKLSITMSSPHSKHVLTLNNLITSLTACQPVTKRTATVEPRAISKVTQGKG